MKTIVFITVDVELSMGGAWGHADLEPLDLHACIWCKGPDGQEHGIRRIMDILEDRGLPGVFFVDTALSEIFSREAYREVCREILDRGHDVQLHLHPGAREYARRRKHGPVSRRPSPKVDWLHSYSDAEQAAMLTEGCRVLCELSGRRPIAFRSGNYAVDDRSLAAIEHAGILADLSYNTSCRGAVCRMPRPVNAPLRVGHMVEIPVTQVLGNHLPGRGYRPLQLNSLGAAEMRRALTQIHDSHQRAACIVLHSFSLVKPCQQRGEALRPNPIATSRLKSLATFLDKHSDQFEVSTLTECQAADGGLERLLDGPEAWPRTSALCLVMRTIGQVASRF